MNKERKILLVLIDWFYPGYRAGGPIQSCTNLVLALRSHYDIRVITSDTDHLEEQPYEGIQSDRWLDDVMDGVQIYYMSKASRNIKKLGTLISEVQPDIVYLNHMFSPLFVIAPLYLNWRRAFDATTIVCPRGALFESALSIKRYKKMPFLWLFRITGMERKVRFHATNVQEKEAILAYFPGAEVGIADNLPNMMQPALQPKEKKRGELDMLFIARVHPIKNLLHVLEALKGVEGKINFTIIGPVEDHNYWELCQSVIASLPPAITVKYAGPIPNQELGKWIGDSHLFVLPTKGENFGHAIFEGLRGGRPVLISDQTPWRGLQEKGIGWDLPLGGQEAWRHAISEAVNWSQADFDSYAGSAWQYAADFSRNPRLIESYLALIA